MKKNRHEILLFFLLLPEPHCPKPAVDHGREAYNSKNDYTVGTKVRIECDEGYTLSTQQLVTCQADGNWFPSLPYCQKGTYKAGAVISTGAGQAAFLQHHPWGAGRWALAALWGCRGLPQQMPGRSWAQAVTPRWFLRRGAHSHLNIIIVYCFFFPS